jgi:hypothetical protein|uniref:MH1 domain n=1 Tax=virus sp. ctrcb4 TaxID=2825824 RepID=A0A8S5RPY0_9VIRU|nr:MAG TPA: MH1 domain [virus sp. ctrcb4]
MFDIVEFVLDLAASAVHLASCALDIFRWPDLVKSSIACL